MSVLPHQNLLCGSVGIKRSCVLSEWTSLHLSIVRVLIAARPFTLTVSNGIALDPALVKVL